MPPPAVRMLLLALVLACCGGASPSAREISAAETLVRIERHDPPLVLDVRTPEEFATGHVPGALNVPHEQVPARLAELAARKPGGVIVYCERGGRAARAIQHLEAAGFQRVQHLTGDMANWRVQGLPVER